MSDPTLLDHDAAISHRFWFQYLNGYQWSVLVLCALAWMFDCADQIIFTSSRAIAIRDLMPGASEAVQARTGAWATTVFMIGWATGGLVFGVIGDKWGRAKTMGLTVLFYAMFTGLSALSRTPTEFAISRFVTGFGVGGEFAAGAALVADVMPRQARAQALGLLQALSAVGNIVGSFMLQVVSRIVGNRPDSDHYTWRYLYLVGALPALIAVIVMVRMKEPDNWVRATRAAREAGVNNFGRISDLFSDRRWRRNTIVGLSLAIAGVIGLWGISFYSPELIDSTFPAMTQEAGASVGTLIAAPNDAARTGDYAVVVGTSKQVDAAGKPTLDALAAEAVMQGYRTLLDRTRAHGETLPKELGDLGTIPLDSERQQKINALLAKRLAPQQSATLKSNALMLQQVGGFCGMLMFSILAVRIGRRPTFVIAFIAAWASIWIVFLGFHHQNQIWYLYPLLGFCTLLPFGGYAVYFPELFPTRLRTTGTGFCYNVGRYIASAGPILLSMLLGSLVGVTSFAAFRVAAVIVSSIYLIGIIAAFFGPETKDQPLPEDAYGVAH